jgi:hypothetical protein
LFSFAILLQDTLFRPAAAGTTVLQWVQDTRGAPG